MKIKSKWKVEQIQRETGVSASIKEVETGLIVADFPPVDRYNARERLLGLNTIIDEYNSLIEKSQANETNS